MVHVESELLFCLRFTFLHFGDDLTKEFRRVKLNSFFGHELSLEQLLNVVVAVEERVALYYLGRFNQSFVGWYRAEFLFSKRDLKF